MDGLVDGVAVGEVDTAVGQGFESR